MTSSRHLLAVAALVAAPFPALRAAEPSRAEAAAGVVRRVFGDEAASRFAFAPLPADPAGTDRFDYAASGGRVTVRGTGAVALTST